MCILNVLLHLKFKLDNTAAFVHADVEEDKHVYVEMSHGFRKQDKVLKPKKTFMGCNKVPCILALFHREDESV